MECTALHCTAQPPTSRSVVHCTILLPFYFLIQFQLAAFLIAQTPQDIHNKLSITPVYATLAYYRTKGALARLE
jgi:hypothetical protein